MLQGGECWLFLICFENNPEYIENIKIYSAYENHRTVCKLDLYFYCRRMHPVAHVT
jgi:hypothetical protein